MEKLPKTPDEIVQGVSDPSKRRAAVEWVKDLERKSGQWSIVKKGEDIDQELLRETPEVEFHGIPMFRCLAGTDVNQIDAYHQARELAESRGKPQMMDSYATLTLATEVWSRLKDGSLVISGMDEETGPVLVSAESGE